MNHHPNKALADFSDDQIAEVYDALVEVFLDEAKADEAIMEMDDEEFAEHLENC